MLVERSDELGVLTKSLTDRDHGGGSVVLISGPVASGKTELLSRFSQEAVGSGALLLKAAGSRAERHLPLGVVGQLLQSAALPYGDVQRRLSPDAEDDEGGLPPATARLIDDLCQSVLDLTDRAPVVIMVDDVHQADPASLQWLLYLVRRSRSVPLSVILTMATGPEAESRLLAFNAEFVAQPHTHRVRLGPLSGPGTEALLAEQVGAARASELGADCYAITGGNPLLVHALIEDHHGGPGRIPRQRRGRLVAGDAFREAVLVLLHRFEPAVQLGARGLAVLDSATGPQSLHHLTDLECAQAGHVLQVLETAGLIRQGRFSSTVARLAVLDDMAGDERAALFLRAAELLRGEGATPTVIAEHLVAAGAECPAWGVQVLCAAAEQALARDRTHLALEQLRLAERSCADRRQRASIDAALARVEWRMNPAAMVRVPRLITAFADGHLRPAEALFPVSCLLWQGRHAEAAAVIEQLAGQQEEQDQPYLRAFHLWIATSFPTMLEHLPHDPVGSADPAPPRSTITLDARLRAPETLATVLRFGPTAHAVTEAERVLQGCRLDHTTVQALELALLTLMYVDHQDKAAYWCDLLLSEASDRQAPLWHAVFAATRAGIALRQGELPAAEKHARTALSLIPEHGWGVSIGGPLGALVHATTAMGKHDVAAEALAVPVPEPMLRTRWGLSYLHARGNYHLAVNQLQAALSDFLTCGELMVEWNIDLPALIPWRSEAAHVYLRLGQEKQARRLAKAQLDRVGDQRARTHGISLRALAAASELRHRPGLLQKASEELLASGDKLEFAKVLADLGDTRHLLGDLKRARMTVRRARHVARECHSASLRARLFPDWMDNPAEQAAEPEAELTALSDAERRVATLAAMGHTNREIARKLYITVSTVEQHLTRVYRKLDVHRRTDLPLEVPRGSWRNGS